MKEEIEALIAAGKIGSASAKLMNNADKLDPDDFDALNKKIKNFPVYARTAIDGFPAASGKSGSRPSDGGNFHHRYK